MVKRFEPCHKYFDQWDENGYSSCEEARDGEYVRYETYKTEHARLTAQIERLKKHVSVLNAQLKEAKESQQENNTNCFQ